MRIIGHLADEAAAHTFGDYLYVQGLENLVEPHEGQGWAVWVHDEDKLDEAAQLLNEFKANPADAKYRAKAKSASELRQDKAKAEAEYRKKVHDRGALFRPYIAYGFGRLTLGLIVICVGVFILSRFGTDERVFAALSISNFFLASPMLPEVRQGEIWRLVTPIFIHFDILHIFFNMLWLRDLGSMIEGRQGTRRLLVLVLVIAVVSNLAQYMFGRNPAFGGMSGVVYGLLGYVWLRGKSDPASGLFLHPSTVTMMLIWLVACYTGLLGHVANWTHTAGLLLGMAWGYLPALRIR